MTKKLKREKPTFAVSGRERPEWDTAALAQLVLASGTATSGRETGRQRVDVSFGRSDVILFVAFSALVLFVAGLLALRTHEYARMRRDLTGVKLLFPRELPVEAAMVVRRWTVGIACRRGGAAG